MVGDPTGRSARAVKHGTKDQRLLHRFVQLDGAVRQRTVITNCGPQAAEADQKQGQTQHQRAGNRKQDEPGDGQRVYGDQIKENSPFAFGGLPEWALLWRADYRGRFRSCLVHVSP